MTLRNITATLLRPLSLAVAVLVASAPACSEKKTADDDEDGPGEGGAGGAGGGLCVPQALSCQGGNLVRCNEDGTGYSSIVDCSPLSCISDDLGPTCGESPGAGGAGGSGGSTGGSGGDTGGSGGATGGAGGAGGATGGTGGESGGGAGGSDGATGGGGGTGGATGGSGGSGGSAGSSPGDPCTTDGLFLCDCIPSFGGAEQTLDGAGDEFAGVPPMTFEVSALPYLSASYNASIPAEVTVRAAWSADAFVAHVHLTDPLLQPDSSQTLWNGDNVQLFLAGTAVLTGAYSGTEDGGATHLIVVPPTDTAAARGITIYEPCYACVMVTALSTSVYAARAVADGWEVELRVPWAATAEPRASGTRIGFDLMFGVADPVGTGLALEGALKNNPTLSSTSCSPTPVTHPGCDDRVWCTPRLE